MNQVGVTDDKEEMVIMPKWRAIELGGKPAKEDTGRTVSRVGAQVSQNQQYVPPPVLNTVPVSQSSKPHELHPEYEKGNGLIR